MRNVFLSLFAISGLLFATNVSAASLEERLAAMEQRLQQLEQKVMEQDELIRQKDEQLARLESGGDGAGDWFQEIELSGVVEVDAQNIEADAAQDSSDITVSTLELGVVAKINDWTSAEVVLLYEDDGTQSGEIDVDVATITIADPDGPWQVTAGQFTMPFGSFESQMLADPLTLELGEIHDAALMLDYSIGNFNLAAYIFNGDITQGGSNEIDNIGLTAGYHVENEDSAFSFQLGLVNDIAESAGIQGGLATTNTGDHINAWTASAVYTRGPWTVIGEYLAASEHFNLNELAHNGRGAKPEAWNLELGYGFEFMNREAGVAFGVQGTEDASAILPEDKALLAFAVALFDDTWLSFEYSNEEDYAGADTNMLTGRLAVEF